VHLESDAEEFEDNPEDNIRKDILKDSIQQHDLELLVIFFKHFVSFLNFQ
jgi:hypothetical protein